tara:strand:- start:320 stop:778 length:459 start_codon:yes stop_codon:yes gene_type:complete
MLDIHDKIFNLVLKNQQNEQFEFSKLKTKKFILYFYPKDDTPGCTKEAIAFKENKEKINNFGYSIIGVSKDSADKHMKFSNKYDLNFTLLSDENLELCKIFNVWVEKNMYGKKYMGIERSTFIIHENFSVKKIWSKVKVNGHIEDIFAYISG